MEIINEGAITGEELLICLKQHFGNSEYYSGIEESIGFISNYTGRWTIGFVGVPPIKTVLALTSILDSEILPQYADNLDQIVFNHGKTNKKVFDFGLAQDLFTQKETFLALLSHADWKSGN